MMKETLTISIQNYLKAIYDLTASGGPASTNALAARLGIAPASVTGMVQRLAAARPPLLRYRKHQGVTLTPQGERAALEVIRHHRLLETYLVNALGYSWDEVHKEAEKLEHVISEDLEARMANALGNPARDPHGDPIPSADLTMPPTEDIPLSELLPRQQAIVRRVRDEDAALLRHLRNLGIMPGTRVKALEQSPFDGNLRLGLKDAEITLGQAVTSQIFVEVQR